MFVIFPFPFFFLHEGVHLLRSQLGKHVSALDLQILIPFAVITRKSKRQLLLYKDLSLILHLIRKNNNQVLKVKPLSQTMVSFHKALAESPRPEIHAEFEASSKKRKWEEPFAEDFFKDQTTLEKKKSIFDIEIHPETPFSSEKWRQYLTIQVSNYLYFYVYAVKTYVAKTQLWNDLLVNVWCFFFFFPFVVRADTFFLLTKNNRGPKKKSRTPTFSSQEFKHWAEFQLW